MLPIDKIHPSPLQYRFPQLGVVVQKQPSGKLRVWCGLLPTTGLGNDHRDCAGLGKSLVSRVCPKHGGIADTLKIRPYCLAFELRTGCKALWIKLHIERRLLLGSKLTSHAANKADHVLGHVTNVPYFAALIRPAIAVDLVINMDHSSIDYGFPDFGMVEKYALCICEVCLEGRVHIDPLLQRF